MKIGTKLSTFMCLLCTVLWIITGIRAYKNNNTSDMALDIVLAIVFAALMVWSWKNTPKSK